MQEKKGAFTGICLRWLDKKTSSPNGGLIRFNDVYSNGDDLPW